MLEAEARAKVNLERVRAEFDARMAACERQHQVELERLRMVGFLSLSPFCNLRLSVYSLVLQPKPTHNQAVDCCSPSCPVSPSDYPILSALFSSELFTELISIIGVEGLLPSLEAHAGPFLQKVALTLVKRIAEAFTKSVLAVIKEYNVSSSPS